MFNCFSHCSSTIKTGSILVLLLVFGVHVHVLPQRTRSVVGGPHAVRTKWIGAW